MNPVSSSSSSHVPLPMMLRNGKFPGFGSASSGFTLFGAQNMFHPSMNMFDPQQSLLELTQSNPQNDLARNREDDLDSKSESENIEGLSGDEQTGSQRKRKKYHRHTQHQIQEMEGFFKECPHPDDKQRKELGRQLGLEPLQVKFWFQNKRTQMKTQQERHENQQLRTENEKLRIENMRMKEALANASCPTCGGPTTVGEMSFDETQLRVENSRLREEIDRITTIAAKYAGKPMLQYPGMAPQSTPRSLDMSVGTLGMLHGMGGDVYAVSGNEDNRPPPVSVIGEAEKPLIVEIAVAGMEELIRMIQLDDPLWVKDVGSGLQILNREEYTRLFPRSPRLHGLKPEASRDSAVIIMNPINLVELLMDVTEWSAMFSTIVSRATTLDVLSTGIAGNYNGALQVMTAEFQVATPLVPTRESFFARYCKRHQDGAWAVVDVSLDHLHHSPLFKCHKRPSGCLIEELPNGYSKVTWVEHVEVDDRTVHDIYRDLINSTIAFGATRWVSTLDRKVQRIAAPLIDNMPPEDPGVLSNDNGRKSMLRLAQRMMTTFCGGVSASTAHTWTQLSGSGADDVRVMTRKSVDDPGRPPGIVLSAATSFWLPISPKRLFDFLRDPENRHEWDVLSSGGEISDVAHIVNGRDPSNSACLLRVNATHPSQGNMLILQESLTDPSGSFVVYAPIDMLAMNMVLGGGNPDYVQLLPSGFAILPDGSKIMNGPESGEVETGGCLITVAFQILVDSTPNAKLSLGSVATVNNLIACTVEKVKVAVGIDT